MRKLGEAHRMQVQQTLLIEENRKYGMCETESRSRPRVWLDSGLGKAIAPKIIKI